MFKFFILFIFMLNLYSLQAELPRLIPMKDFFRNPQQTAFQLSPNGEYISFMQPIESRLNIHIQKIGEEKVTPITHATKRDIAGYLWVSNSRIAYIQDTGGDENFRGYAVDIDGKNFKELTPFDGVRVTLIDELENNDDEILIGMNKRDARVFDVYRINVHTGEMKMIAENPGNVASWITDHDGKLRVATTTDGVNVGVLYRETEEAPFELILQNDFRNALAPLFFTFDNKNLYVASNIGRDKTAIYFYDLAQKKTTDLIYEHPEVDVTQLLASKKREIITGVTYVTEKRHYHFFDADRKKLQEDIEARLPGYDVVIASMSKDETKILVVQRSDKTRGSYYFYDRVEGKFQKLVDMSPWLKESEMAEMKTISYKSRDGLTISGYLTLPKGLEPKNLPVLVNPHGGPWHRDQWGFNPEVQFFANRGYAVFQMNFRGSTGYGRKFWEASFKRWGKEMQDDITDGVQWLIDEGIANPKKIGIYGASYGGYATLAGLVFTPDLYACGVDYVGVSNIFTLLSSIPPYWKPMLSMLHEMIGHPEKDKELLREASPVFHADKIKAPLLIAQGANDPRVKKAESDQMVEALKKRGIEVPYIVKDNEGHGFHNEENRFEFYREMEKFLAKHLGGRME